MLVLLAINLLHAVLYQPLLRALNLTDNPWVWIYSYRFFISWPFYFFLGAVFQQHKLEDRLSAYRGWIIGGWAVLLAVMVGMNIAHIGYPIDAYNSVIGTLFSTLTILILLIVPVRGKVIILLSQTSYYLYLSHYFFISFINYLGERFNIDFPFWFAGVCLAACLGGSLLLYWAAKKLLKQHTTYLLGA